MWNCFPCSTWSLMSSIATKIPHGRKRGQAAHGLRARFVKKRVEPLEEHEEGPHDHGERDQANDTSSSRREDHLTQPPSPWLRLGASLDQPGDRAQCPLVGCRGATVGPEPSAVASPSGEPGPSGGTTAGAPCAVGSTLVLVVQRHRSAWPISITVEDHCGPRRHGAKGNAPIEHQRHVRPGPLACTRRAEVSLGGGRSMVIVDEAVAVGQEPAQSPACT